MSLFSVASRLLAAKYVPRPVMRGIVRTAAALIVARMRSEERRQAKRPSVAEAPEEALYLVDGYHGGVIFWDWLGLRGGGLWRLYNWPVCVRPAVQRAMADGRFRATLDFDCLTYEWMARNDPAAIALIRAAIAQGRLEIVNGTYGQPFARAESGETFLRHLELGTTVVRTILGVDVKTFYSQEPAYFPQLPQLLRGMHYEQVVFRTQWAAFGTDPAFDADVVLWKAPDGTGLPTVPRYSFQNYDRQLAHHPGLAAGSLGMGDLPDHAPESLAPFCRAARRRSITHPLATDLKDANIPDAPLPHAEVIAATRNLRFTTIEEYVRRARPATSALSPSLAEIPCTLPWGLQADEVPRATADAESCLHVAERLDAAAFVYAGRQSSGEALEKAWKDLCLAQHHDLYVCGPWHSRAHGGPMSRVAESYADSARVAGTVVANDALLCLAAAPAGDVIVFNPAPHDRRDYVEASVPRSRAPLLSGHLFMRGTDGIYPCQIVSEDREKIRLAFLPRVPAFAVAHFNLEQDAEAKDEGRVRDRLVLQGDGSVEIRDPQGSTVAGGLFFTVMRDGTMFDSRREASRAAWVCRGPVFGSLEIRGSVAGIGFVHEITAYEGMARIDGCVRFDFDESGVYLGPQRNARDGEDPYSIRDEEKLSLALSTPFSLASCESPFWLGECTGERAASHAWVGAERVQGTGVALINRGTRGYNLDSRTGILRNILAWGPREWIYASDDSLARGKSRYTALRGRQMFAYSVAPYDARIDAVRSGISRSLPLRALWRTGDRAPLPDPSALMSVDSHGLVVSSLRLRESALHARLWNASGGPVTVRIEMGRASAPREKLLEIEGSAEALTSGLLAVPPWGVCSVRGSRLS